MNEYNHLSLTERCMIEKYLAFGYKFKEIAKALNRNPTTISREVKNHRTVILSKNGKCRNFMPCLQRKICEDKQCMKPCKTCESVSCIEKCSQFLSYHCKILDKTPYVCNNCLKQDFCKLEREYYQAHTAHKQYLSSLSESRKSIHITSEKSKELDLLITPLIKQGQSVSHIFSTHSDEIGVSRKTVYNYIDRCVFKARNIDLPRKVRYRKRKSKQSEPFPYKFREGRTYKDFKIFMEKHPNTDIVEMDTVKGKRDKGKCLLTMIFTKYDFMLIFLLENASQECVEEVFDFLVKALGLNVFRRLFPVILTDNLLASALLCSILSKNAP